MKKLIRVVIADDDDMLRSLLVEVLETDGRFEVARTAASAPEAVEAVARARPDVALLDVRMPGGGVMAAQQIRDLDLALGRGSSAGTGPPVVVAISAHTGIAVVVSMLAAGATGYLAKGRLRDLPDLVARCAVGEVVLAVPSGAAALRHVAQGGDVGLPGPRRPTVG